MEILLAILVQFVLPIVTSFIGYLTAVQKSKKDNEQAWQQRVCQMQQKEDKLREDFSEFLRQELSECQKENEELLKKLNKQEENE